MNKLIIIGLSFIFLLSSCVAQAEPKVVVTIGMLGDIVKEIGGECVDVEVMMGPGIDPHLYKASAGDVQTLQNADIIFYSGLHLEGQLGEVFENLAQRRPVIAVAESAIPEESIITTSSDYGVDPHVWMDSSLWAQTTDVIAEELSKLKPDCASDINTRAQTYKPQLLALHDWVKASIASIPEEQRILVTAHDAFFYYANAYTIDVAGIQGISTESEAAIADIRDTVDIIVERNVPAIFVESTINPRTIEAVKQAVEDRGQSIIIGGELFSDAMGESGTAAGTYIGMIFENTKAITEALGGQTAPLPAELSGWAQQWDIE